MMMVVNTFLCVFLNTIWRFSCSCLENQVSGAWISMSAYGKGTAISEKRRRGDSQLQKHLDVDFKGLGTPPSFSVMFSKRDDFPDFLFAYLVDQIILNGVYS